MWIRFRLLLVVALLLTPTRVVDAAHVWKDRVSDTTTTTGTGVITVSGTAPSKYITFSAVLSVNDTFCYVISHRTAAQWETGLATYSGVNQITRTTVAQSSNANAAVSLSAGTKDVYLSFNSTCTMGVTQGGTGQSALADYTLLAGGSPVRQVASVGTSGQVLTSAGVGALPTWTTATGALAIGSAVSGGTNNAALYIDPTGNLGAEAAFGYNASTNTLLAEKLNSTTGVDLAVATVAPTATTGPCKVGLPISFTASNGVASTDTAGACAGGPFNITTGNGARLTSGNANGGDYTITTGSGIGTGVPGKFCYKDSTQTFGSSCEVVIESSPLEAGYPGLRLRTDNAVNEVTLQMASAAGFVLTSFGDIYMRPTGLDFIVQNTAGSISPLQINTTAGDFRIYRTVTGAGTTGAQTINKPNGTVNFAAAATSLVVTNSLAAATSTIFLQPQTNDTTCKSFTLTRAAGSFTIATATGCTAETPVAFWVFN